MRKEEEEAGRKECDGDGGKGGRGELESEGR